jgi:hypothetical protein
VPPFVHRLRDFQTFQTTSLPASWSQGAPRCAPAGNAGALFLSTRRLAGAALRCEGDVRRRLAHRVLSDRGNGRHERAESGRWAGARLAVLAPGASRPIGGIAHAQDQFSCLAGTSQGWIHARRECRHTRGGEVPVLSRSRESRCTGGRERSGWKDQHLACDGEPGLEQLPRLWWSR